MENINNSERKAFLVHSDNYSNWIFDPTHPTQGRRFINARDQFAAHMTLAGEPFVEEAPRLATREELLKVHSPSYIEKVVDKHRSGEWAGERAELAELASTFVGGTLVALDALITKGARTAIHFPGAKHHAQWDHSSGFCVFNDFAIASDIATKQYGLKVAILDIDAHHGDGTENLTADNPNVLTFSIHESGIFPGTGKEDHPEDLVFNHPLHTDPYGEDRGSDDSALMTVVNRFITLAQTFKPDLVFIACGADGHLEDPLTNLEYSVAGYVAVAHKVRDTFPKMPILMGGAGGYLPDTRTPEIWAAFARELVLASH